MSTLCRAGQKGQRNVWQRNWNQGLLRLVPPPTPFLLSAFYFNHFSSPADSPAHHSLAILSRLNGNGDQERLYSDNHSSDTFFGSSLFSVEWQLPLGELSLVLPRTLPLAAPAQPPLPGPAVRRLREGGEAKKLINTAWAKKGAKCCTPVALMLRQMLHLKCLIINDVAPVAPFCPKTRVFDGLDTRQPGLPFETDTLSLSGLGRLLTPNPWREGGQGLNSSWNTFLLQNQACLGRQVFDGALSFMSKLIPPKTTKNPFFCPTHLSAILPLVGGLVVRGLISRQKIKANQGKSSLIKVNQGILEHFKALSPLGQSESKRVKPVTKNANARSTLFSCVSALAQLHQVRPQSARGLAHSRTLRAIRQSSEIAPAFWSATALRRF